MSESEPVIELDPDEPPKDGKWADPDSVIGDPTEDELDQGRQMGQRLPDEYDEELDDES